MPFHVIKNIQSVLVLLLLCSSTHTIVASEKEDKKNNIKMFTMDFIPYGHLDKNGQPSGILFEVLNRVLKEAKIVSHNQIMPIKRLMSIMDSGQKSCTMMADTGEYAESFLILASTGISANAGVISRKGIQIPDYLSLKDLTIAVPHGLYFDERFDKDTSLTKVSPPEYFNALQMLKLKRVDAVAGAIPIISALAKALGMNDDDFETPLILTEHELYLICKKSIDQKVLNTLKIAMNKLREEGVIQEILDRYYSKGKTEKLDVN